MLNVIFGIAIAIAALFAGWIDCVRKPSVESPKPLVKRITFAGWIILCIVLVLTAANSVSTVRQEKKLEAERSKLQQQVDFMHLQTQSDAQLQSSLAAITFFVETVTTQIDDCRASFQSVPASQGSLNMKRSMIGVANRKFNAVIKTYDQQKKVLSQDYDLVLPDVSKDDGKNPSESRLSTMREGLPKNEDSRKFANVAAEKLPLFYNEMLDDCRLLENHTRNVATYFRKVAFERYAKSIESDLRIADEK